MKITRKASGKISINFLVQIQSYHSVISILADLSIEEKKKVKSKGKASKVQGQVSPGKPGQMQCNQCSKLFNNSSALAKHKLTHSAERKFLCTICEKKFKRQDHL